MAKSFIIGGNAYYNYKMKGTKSVTLMNTNFNRYNLFVRDIVGTNNVEDNSSYLENKSVVSILRTIWG